MAEIITIDGPVASGKGTIARELALYLGWQYLDSGALYRLLALVARRSKVSLADENGLSTLAQYLMPKFIDTAVYLGAEEVTAALRAEDVGLNASQIAAFPEVRRSLLARQRDFLRRGNLVADGRDMGTVVFPEAGLKIFLTATAAERARRRIAQLGLQASSPAAAAILTAIEKRDVVDQNRLVAPLKPAADARLLDSTGLTVADTLKKIISWYQELKK